MKNLNKYENFYTDPVVYEEGIFKDKADEIKFLKSVEKLTARMKAERLSKQKTA